MKRNLSNYSIVLIIIIVVALALIFLENASAITGHYVDRNTISNVTISSYYAVDWSDSILYYGITFEEITSLPMTDDNATENWFNPPLDNSSGYWANISQDSNVPMDVCIRADWSLNNSDGDIIGLGNETYISNVTSTNFTFPWMDDGQTALDTVLTESASNIYAGNTTYWRFWLDVPSGQPVGVYNNTIYFRADTDGDCTT